VAQTPSPFGPVEGTVWLEDPPGDTPPGSLDVLAVGIGSVDVADPGALRDADWLLKLGRAKQAVRPGSNVLVRVVLDRPLSEISEGHAGIHVATDRDRSRSNNAPAGVGEGEQPFAGSEDVASVVYATTTGATSLLDSDLAQGWYEDDDEFAAAWAAPAVLDLLFRPEALGDGLSVVAFTSGTDGYDVVSLDPAAIPLDGTVGLRPLCLEASLTGQPYVVRRLTENGQTLRDVETPSSWLAGASFRPDETTLEALRDFVSAADDDADGRVAVRARASLSEDGTAISQRPDVIVALDGERIQLALQLGITRRGYEVLRDLKLEPTGDAVVDAWLARAADAFLEAMPPFRSGRQAGVLVGDGIGSCATQLIEASDPASARASDRSADPASDPSAEALTTPDSATLARPAL
jgi:hypothetical protein